MKELALTFIQKYESLRDVLTDRKLASFGDAYVNFVYSLALSFKSGSPVGARVKRDVLAEALRRAGLKGELPPRTSRRDQANAVEALIAYALAKGIITTVECVKILTKSKDDVSAFYELIGLAKGRLNL